MDIRTIFKAGVVKRWHNKDMLLTQNDAEHSFNGALLCAYIGIEYNKKLAKSLPIMPIPYPPKVRIEDAVMWFLLHDAAEQYTGDMPSYIKSENSIFSETMHKLEHNFMQTEMEEFLPYMNSLSPIEKIIVQFVDQVEAYHFSLKNYLKGDQLNKWIPMKIMENIGVWFLDGLANSEQLHFNILHNVFVKVINDINLDLKGISR